MMPAATERREVWLRGNLRPAAASALALVVIAAALMAAVWLVDAPSWAWAIAAGVAAAIVAVAASLVWVSAQPRLARQGDAILVRLMPLAATQVPLEIVECVFRGTEPVVVADGPPRFRVGTLVVRLAERATEWRTRPTLRSWGSWDDGHIVIDGRWCEPLLPASAQRIATRLADAKREGAAGRQP